MADGAVHAVLLLGDACPWQGKHLPKHLREATWHPPQCPESYGLGFESQFFGSQKTEGEGEGFVAALGSRLRQN